MNQAVKVENTAQKRVKMKLTLSSALEFLFLKVPFERKPGILAMILSVLRMTLFGFGGTTLLVLAGFKFDTVGQVLSWCSFVFFEELGRYAFLRKADNIVRASIFFFLSIVLIETISYYRTGVDPLAYAKLRAPSVIVHALATSLMAWAIRHPKFKLPTFVGIVLLHAAFDFWASHLTA